MARHVETAQHAPCTHVLDLGGSAQDACARPPCHSGGAMSTAAERKRRVYGALIRLESQTACRREGRTSEGHDMINGHEVQCRVTLASYYSVRVFWKLNGNRIQEATLRDFLLSDAGREA